MVCELIDRHFHIVNGGSSVVGTYRSASIKGIVKGVIMSVLMWIAGAAALGAGAIGWMRAEARGYRVREEEVVSERVPHSFDGFRILFITDIHRRQLSEKSYYPIYHRWIAYCLVEILRKEACPFSV